MAFYDDLRIIILHSDILDFGDFNSIKFKTYRLGSSQEYM